MNQIDLLEIKERLFISRVLLAFDELKSKNYKNASKYMKDSVVDYHEMDGIIQLALQILIPEYSNNNDLRDTNSKIVSSTESEEYISSLKDKISKIAYNGRGEDILRLFKEYDREEFYDSGLITLKSAVLMSENSLDYAEACLDQGLKKYPDDFHILSNYCKLYSLKQNYQKCAEVFCKARIIYPEKNILDLNKIIPQTPLISN